LQDPFFTTFQYDAADNLVAQSSPRPNDEIETDRSIYDAAGNLTRTIDGRGDETVRRYDLVGNQVKFTDPARNSTTYVYDNLDRLMEESTASGTRKYAYAATGNLTLLVDRNERAIRRQYDRLDRPTLEWWYASESDARANNSSYSDLTSYFYDNLGRPDEEQYLHRVQVGGVWQNDYRVTESACTTVSTGSPSGPIRAGTTPATAPMPSARWSMRRSPSRPPLQQPSGITQPVLS
jgi:YD repeat-containing protein